MLTEKRKSDRAEMARQLSALALSFDFGAVIYPEPTFLRDHRTTVALEFPRGLRLNVDFDGKSCQPDIFVLSWHMDFRFDTRLKLSFATSVNSYHHQKGTDIAEGFPQALELLRRRFEVIASGEAFEGEG